MYAFCGMQCSRAACFFYLSRLGQLDFTPVAMIGCTTQLCHGVESKMATYKSYPVTSNTARGEQQKLGMTGAL